MEELEYINGGVPTLLKTRSTHVIKNTHNHANQLIRRSCVESATEAYASMSNPELADLVSEKYEITYGRVAR